MRGLPWEEISRPFKDYSIDRLRPPDYQKSLSYLSKVRDEVIPPYLQIQKNLAMAMDYYIGLKEYKPAEEALAKARRLIADRSEFQVFLEQVARAQQPMKP